MSAVTDRAVNRLAQYRPFAHEGRDVMAALRDLVLGAAAESGGGFKSLGTCQDAIAILFNNLEIEIDELRRVVKELVDQEVCERDGAGFKLTAVQVAAMERAAEESKTTEENAFRSWEQSVRLLNADLTNADFAGLKEDLESWLEQVIARHGVEAALLLYPESPRAHQLYNELDELGFSFLPSNRSACALAVREQAIQLFVQQPTPEQRTHLSNLLNVTYFLTVLSLDPSASQIVKEQVHGHRIYLDTNVLYRVLGLSKVREVLSVRRLLELAKELGYELAMTPWTLEELKESLRRAEQSVKSRALPPRELANMMADATSQEGFITAYWRQYKEKGISPKDFFEFYSALQTLLEDDGITLRDQGTRAIDRDQEAINRDLPVLESVLTHEKAPPVLEHDVKHRLLVERLRGATNVSFANARFWFLTQDSALARYAEKCGRDQDSGVPFCASTSAWAQVMRSLVPRTDDLDQALVDLLASPYMRYRGGISPRAVQDAVGRIDQYEGVSPSLASEVLLNGALMREISSIDDPDARKEKIDNALVRGAANLHERIQTISEAEAVQREALRQAEVEKLSSKEEAKKAYARIDELQQALAAHQEKEQRMAKQLEQAGRERDKEGREAASKADAERKAREELEERVETTERMLGQQADARRRQSRNRRIGLASAVSALAGVLAALLIGLGVITGTWPVLGVVFLVLLVVCASIWLVAGWKRAWQVFVVAGVVIGVVAGLQQIVSGVVDDESSSQTPGR